MGVIDLDARIKKLEQEGTGGAVIDQLESAVTAIENELTVTVTDVTDNITTDPEIISEGVTCTLAVLEKYGAIVHFHAEFAADGGNIGIEGVIYTIPEELRARYSIGAISVSGGASVTCDYEDGEIYAEYSFTGGGFAYADVYWIANPAPAPTPGE